MRSLVRSVVLSAAVAILVSGCGTSKDDVPEPMMSAIPTAPPAGAELICGMDKAALEAATGFTVGRTEDELRILDGVGSGKRSVWAMNESLIDGSLMAVTMFAASSPEGVRYRAKLLGQDGLHVPPQIAYTTVDGGIWGDVEAIPGHMTLGAVSVVFYDDTAIEVLTRSADVGRDPAADQIALTQQVAATYGLVDTSATP